MRNISEISDKYFYVCPVCGYDKLLEEPYDKNVDPSYEICPCCGFEYGFDDKSRKMTFEEYRNWWMGEGMKWFSPNKKPSNWDYKKQLSNIGIELE